MDPHMASLLADSWLLPGCTCSEGSVWNAPPTGTMLKTWEWPQGCTVMDRYLCTVQTVLQGLLVTGGSQGKTLLPSGPIISL